MSFPYGYRMTKNKSIYQKSLYLVYTLDTTIGGRNLDEDDLINHILHNQPPTSMPADELMKESLEKSESYP